VNEEALAHWGAVAPKTKKEYKTLAYVSIIFTSIKPFYLRLVDLANADSLVL
jgi:hypothetical protein